MASPAGADLEEVLLEHRESIVARRDELERIVGRIDTVLHDHRGLLPYEVDLVALKPVWVVSRRTVSSRDGLDDVIDSFLTELIEDLATDGAEPLGREFIQYHNALLWYQGLDMEVCLPVEQSVAQRHGGWELPACTALQTMYRGPWADIWQAYAAMLARMSRKGYEACGPVRETYLVDERDTGDPGSYLTEITWPATARRHPGADDPLDLRPGRRSTL